MPLGVGGGRHQGAQVTTNTDLLVALLSCKHIYRYTAYIDRLSSPPPQPVLFVRAPSYALAAPETSSEHHGSGTVATDAETAEKPSWWRRFFGVE